MSRYDWPEMVKTARIKLGETQEKFAHRFAVATNTVSRWETGTYDVPIEVVEWLLYYTEMRDLKVCPRCAGCGVVSESTDEVKQ